jgi:type IX secretion system PorP/SprF family membrane protein
VKKRLTNNFKTIIQNTTLSYRFILINITILIFYYHSVNGQDIHFSQFQASTIQLNSANTGLYQGKYRFSALYRNQWATVPVNYNTGKFSFEDQLIHSNKFGNFNIGLSFYYDKAGDSRYTTILPNLHLAYAKSFGKKISHTVSFGINVGIIYKQISYQALKFDAQYNGEFYDANMPSFENAGITKNTVFDIGSGIIYDVTNKNKWFFQIGFSTSHINQPNYSFKDNQAIQLNMRYTLHNKIGISLGKKTSTQIDFLFQNQDIKNELVVGFIFKHQLSNIAKNNISFYYGPYYRVNDAAICLIGLEYNSLNIGISYDINTSSFLKGTNSYGATEISAQYIFSPIKKVKIDKSICPIF